MYNTKQSSVANQRLNQSTTVFVEQNGVKIGEWFKNSPKICYCRSFFYLSIISTKQGKIRENFLFFSFLSINFQFQL